MKTIRAEKDYENWIFHSLKKYFINIGFKVHGWSPSTREEKLYGFDILFWLENKDEIKIFALQIKYLKVKPKKKNSDNKHDNRNNIKEIRFEDLHFAIDLEQLKEINEKNVKAGKPYIFYVIPLYTNPIFDEVAINHCAIVNPKNISNYLSNNEKKTIEIPLVNLFGVGKRIKYFCWSTFIQKIFNCKLGLSISYRIRENITSVKLLDKEYNVTKLDRYTLNDILKYLANPEKREETKLLVLLNFTREKVALLAF